MRQHERAIHARHRLAANFYVAGRRVDANLDEAVAADFAALAYAITRTQFAELAGEMQVGADGGIGAAGDRVFRNSVRGAEGAHDQSVIRAGCAAEHGNANGRSFSAE